MNTIRFMYKRYKKWKIKWIKICSFLFNKTIVYHRFSQSSNIFLTAIRTLVVPSVGKSYPDRTVIYKRAPRLRRTGVPLLMTEIAARISLGLQPAGGREPFIFLLVNNMLSKRETNLYFPNGWLSIWGSISGPEMELNLGYTSLKSLYQRKMHLMWNKKMA